MIALADIMAAAADAWGSTLDDMRGASRAAHHVKARRLAMGLLRELREMSYAAVAEFMGRKDFGTARHACGILRQELTANTGAEARVYNTVRTRLIALAPEYPAATPDTLAAL